MKVTFYTSSAEKIRVDKTAYLTEIATVEGTMRDTLDMFNPVITFPLDLESFNTVNYLYISTFDRYYFITDCISLRSTVTEVKCHEDVLMSYRNSIKKQYAIIARNQNNYSLYIDDSQFKAYQNFEEGCITFPAGFSTSNFSYVLMLAGDSDYVPVAEQDANT